VLCNDSGVFQACSIHHRVVLATAVITSDSRTRAPMPAHPSRLEPAAAAAGGVLGACCAGRRPDGCCPDAGGNSCPPPAGGGGAGATLAADTGCAGAAEATATAAGLSSATALNPSTATAVRAVRDGTGRTAPSSRRIQLAQRRHSTARLRRPHRRRTQKHQKGAMKPSGSPAAPFCCSQSHTKSITSSDDGCAPIHIKR